MAVREAEPVGSLHEVREAGLDREDLLGIYRNLLITRGIEERGHIQLILKMLLIKHYRIIQLEIKICQLV